MKNAILEYNTRMGCWGGSYGTLLQERGRGGRHIYLYIRMPGEQGWTGNLFKNNDDALSDNGSSQKWRKPGERRRQQSICQGYRVSGRVRDVPVDGNAAGE